MRKFNYSIIFLILSTAISQNIWNGGSVSNPDNLNATLINPAGLGINPVSYTHLRAHET